MSYRLDLDEYDEAVLEKELADRKDSRRKGFCDYCHRQFDVQPSCKFPDRHLSPPIEERGDDK